VTRALKQRSALAAACVAALVGLLLCASPLLGVPGVESALVLGVLLPSFAGAIGARVVDRIRRESRFASASELFADAVGTALLVLAIPTSLLLLDLLRVPVCAPLEGLAFIALGPGVGVILAAVTGIAIAAFVPRTRLATTLAVLAPIAAILVALRDFYATPAIFAYGHFFGYFPGTLYDPDVALTSSYASFRALSAAWILGIGAIVVATWDGEQRRARLSTLGDRWRAGLVALAFVGASATGAFFGPALGHRSDSASIAGALGGNLHSARCRVVFPRELPRREAERLGHDCDVRVVQAEASLGLRQRERITAFFFRNAEEKRALMGASNTYIAKPWRDEVYLQLDEWPHPVLFHELVHIVAGNAGPGPFEIAGRAGGLWPAPGIIEGVAVAVAWEPQDGLTPHQWARAMLELERVPPISRLEGLAFLLEPPSRAYIASGSFVRWILETRGSAAVRRLYRTGSFEAALGIPLARAEGEWRSFLSSVELSASARALARQRFERPGIFGQICPHRIASLQGQLASDLAAGDDPAALRTCREIVALDPRQVGTRALLVGVRARLGDHDEARRELAALEGPPSAAPPVVFRGRQGLADALWLRGERDEAEEVYRGLLREPMSDEDARQIEVRLLALEMGGEGERALRGLLVPPRDVTNDAVIAMAQIAALERARGDGLAAYLEGRQLASRQRFELALPRLREARARGLPTRRLRDEARRLEAIASFGASDLVGSAQLWREMLRDPGASDGQRLEALDWLTRLRISLRASR
jgi:hypothetical protein